ncbi:hypothetical protein EYF80_062814 [Liparis tanakae]|nr:hypothetical protein EYF80_062814 [Liparis tanakae]
MSPVVS